MVNTLFDLRTQGDKAMTANTDGSCESNPGEGSCAFILRDAAGDFLKRNARKQKHGRKAVRIEL